MVDAQKIQDEIDLLISIGGEVVPWVKVGEATFNKIRDLLAERGVETDNARIDAALAEIADRRARAQANSEVPPDDAG
jgi:hypothetical protein